MTTFFGIYYPVIMFMLHRLHLWLKYRITIEIFFENDASLQRK